MKRFRPANVVVCIGRQPVKVGTFSVISTSSFSFFSHLKATIVSIVFFCGINNLSAQVTGEQEAYKKVIYERVTKIVNTLGITDSILYGKLVAIISQQYYSLNSIHDNSRAAIAAIKTESLSNDEKEALVKKEDTNRISSLQKLHEAFVAGLKNYLSGEQVEKIKDGMTYRILPITNQAYQEMLPRLSAEQKIKIYSWLLEAREFAMDVESSEKKHEVFGKYKGKINNYLSAAGYDMKKEGEEWQKRKIAEKETSGK